MHGTMEHTITERDVHVPMRDGVCLATDITRPARAGTPLPGPFPTLIHRTPYDKSAARLSEISSGQVQPLSNIQIAKGLAKAGFVVLTQDCRGRYASEGTFQKYIGEGEDGWDTLKWAAEQTWCSKEFGTFGVSYSAHVQTALAILQPPGLKAMFIDSGGFWNAHQGGVRRGGAFELKQATWAYKHAVLSTEAQADPALAKALKKEDIAKWFLKMPWKRGASPLRHVPSYENYLFDQWERGTFDEFWQKPEFYIVPHYDKLVSVPVFLICGWFDPYAETILEHFRNLSSRGGYAEAILGPWLHGRRSQTFAGDVDFGPFSTFEQLCSIDYNTVRQNWFKKWIKCEGNNEGESHITWFCMGGASGERDSYGRMKHGGTWRHDTQWPPKNAQEMSLFLSDMEGLTQNPPLPHEIQLKSDPNCPVPTIGGAITSGTPVMEGGAYDQETTEHTFGAKPPYGPLAQRPDVLVFCTKPLREDLEIAGPVSVELSLASDAPDLDICIKLIDWFPPNPDYPHGFAMNLTDGILRLRYRKDWSQPVLLRHGEKVTVKIEALPIANLFKKGHRVRLDISGSNFPKFDVNPNTGEDEAKATSKQVAISTLFLGSAHLTMHKVVQ